MNVSFPWPAGATLRVTSVSGHVTIIAEERPDLLVETPKRRVELSDDGRTVTVRTITQRLTMRCPTGADVVVGAVSGHIRLEGVFGSVRAATVSGHIELDRSAGDADLRSVSGHLTVGECAGRCQLNTKSGHISAARAESALRACTLSGRIEVGTTGGDGVEVRTVSGGVRIEVEGQRLPRAHLRSLSGAVRCDCPQGGDFDLKASTVSGSIEVSRR